MRNLNHTPRIYYPPLDRPRRDRKQAFLGAALLAAAAALVLWIGGQA